MTNSSDISAASKQKNIEKAARAKNPFEGITDFPLNYNVPSNDAAAAAEEFSLYCRTKGDMDAKALKWAFKLAERNVSPLYKTLEMGWQPKVKQGDLNKNWARYLVAHDKKRTPVAYAMFRFDMDYGNSVLYCYEMQIEPTAQRKGLGKYMMKGLEQCARHWHMEKVVLTVLNNNTDARAFFKAIGYTLDDSSPDILEKAEYEILSKSIN